MKASEDGLRRSEGEQSGDVSCAWWLGAHTNGGGGWIGVK